MFWAGLRRGSVAVAARAAGVLRKTGYRWLADTSMINGCSASVPWSGARSPTNPQTVARAAARAVSIAFNAASASAASTSMVRDTVGSEATRP